MYGMSLKISSHQCNAFREGFFEWKAKHSYAGKQYYANHTESAFLLKRGCSIFNWPQWTTSRQVLDAFQVRTQERSCKVMLKQPQQQQQKRKLSIHIVENSFLHSRLKYGFWEPWTSKTSSLTNQSQLNQLKHVDWHLHPPSSHTDWTPPRTSHNPFPNRTTRGKENTRVSLASSNLI